MIKDISRQDWNQYVDWLLYECRLRSQYDVYSKLFYLLSDIPFVYDERFHRDKNRIKDSMEFRQLYSEENHIFIDKSDHPVSVLEVLLSLSKRIDREYTGDPSNPRPDRFFMEMIYNLELDIYTNYKMVSSGDYRKVNDILNRWMYRKFKPDGNGSPFPLIQKNHVDQREKEIWDQAMTYLTGR